VKHPCSTCTRPATLTITGRIPGRTCYSALTCDKCAAKHRERARKAGPVVEETIDGPGQDTLW
jgi:protein-arginine kinase activator protein McsA